MVHPRMDVVSWLRKELEAADGDLLREMVQAMAEVLMSAEVRAHCNAGYGECSPERLNVHNGYRPPCWDRRVGTIDLAIPKLRRGSYYPDWLLDPRRQAERALVAVVAECYLAGVSTRRVDDLVRTLGIQGISKSQVSDLAKELDTTVVAFRNRPLRARMGWAGPPSCAAWSRGACPASNWRSAIHIPASRTRSPPCCRGRAGNAVAPTSPGIS